MNNPAKNDICREISNGFCGVQELQNKKKQTENSTALYDMKAPKVEFGAVQTRQSCRSREVMKNNA